MKKLILALATLLIVSCVAERESGPVVNGHPLSFWLAMWVQTPNSAEDRQSAERAIIQAGTNAIPYLIGELSALEQVEKSPAPSIEHIRQAARRSDAAAGALGLLGQSVTSAIPQLTKLMASDNYETVGSAAGVLSGLGPFGAHAMVVGLTNANPRARAATAAALRDMGTNVLPEVAFMFHSLEGLHKSAAFDCSNAIIHSGVATTNLIFEFTGKLQSTNSVIRYVSAMTLGEMGANASEAIPQLQKLGNDPVKEVRDAADWALARIRTKVE